VRFLKGFLRFWYEFIVGDDWRIAAGVAVVLAFDALLVATTGLPELAVALLATAGIMAVVAASIADVVRTEHRHRWRGSRRDVSESG
jgi:hypothetical protein